MKTNLPLLLLLMFTTNIQASENNQLAAEARTIIKGFATELKQTLGSRMKKSGPVSAIEVCNEKAPEITSKTSENSGWSVTRTSLKIRNHGNQPDQWEQAVLERFEQQKSIGANPKKLEFFEIVNSGSNDEFRYMKAIPTGDVCLACHGETLNESVQQKIDELYPNDHARGFKAGDIRGAFSLRKSIIQ